VAKVIKDSSNRASLVGYCLASSDAVAGIQTHCRRMLLPTSVPSVIVPLQVFKRLPNGKVDINNLPEPDWTTLAAGEVYKAPNTPLQADLIRLWMEALEVSQQETPLADS
jgi:hypothetical protein